MSERFGNLGRVKRQSLAHQIADLLRTSIEQGTLGPGTHLIETEIAQEMGVSRGILREALCRLEQEGLVESQPGKGRYVATLSERDVREIYSLRRILEGEAARRAALNASPEDVAELENILEAMFACAHRCDRSEVIEKDLKFHQKIWKMADHLLLKSILDGFKVQIAAFLRVDMKADQDMVAVCEPHRLVLDSIRNRDGDMAAEHMIRGMELFADLAIDSFKQTRQDGSA